MPRIKLTVQYKGTNYHGWQVQPNGVTIQEVLQKTLHRILNQKVNVIGSGRTDSGVHALAQVCHFDYVGARFPRPGGETPPLQKIIYGLNSLLPEDIAVVDAKIVPQTFHAQLSAKRKTYDYTLFNSKLRSPFLEDTVWRIPYSLDIKKMKQAAKVLVGEHDFRAFCASDTDVKTTVRKIYKISISVGAPFMAPGFDESNPYKLLIRISVTGNGFLKHSIRNIVGTLVNVGRGKTTVAQFKNILQGKDRKKAGMTAPAKGLMLMKVRY